MKGFTLLEFMVVVIIVAVLTALALPYYYNAVESARMTELVVLWGRQKNFASGYNMSQEQADKLTERLQKANLKYFTGRVFCRENNPFSPICWEAEFTQKEENRHAQYKLVTTHNFARLACIGLNKAGKTYCESQALKETPFEVDGQSAYPVK